jgi:hypothetical protein
MAYEGFRYRQERAGYLGIADEPGSAVYRQCGTRARRVRRFSMTVPSPPMMA